MIDKILDRYKVHIFIGMFGSGKTELAINIALKLKENNSSVAIADLDFVSPYFRVRDKRNMLKEQGIKVITPPEKYMYADVPIISSQISGYITNAEFKTVLDVGGNEEGVRVLGSLKNYIETVDSVTYFVVNTKRPFMQEKENIIRNLRLIEQSSRCKVDYLVANTNLQDETTQEIINHGEDLLEEVSAETNIPIVFTAVSEKFDNHVTTKFEKYTIKLFFTKFGF